MNPLDIHPADVAWLGGHLGEELWPPYWWQDAVRTARSVVTNLQAMFDPGWA